MTHKAQPVRQDSALVMALFAAFDLACDHDDLEIAARLSGLLDRLALREEREWRPEAGQAP